MPDALRRRHRDCARERHRPPFIEHQMRSLPPPCKASCKVLATQPGERGVRAGLSPYGAVEPSVKFAAFGYAAVCGPVGAGYQRRASVEKKCRPPFACVRMW